LARYGATTDRKRSPRLSNRWPIAVPAMNPPPSGRLSKPVFLHAALVVSPRANSISAIRSFFTICSALCLFFRLLSSCLGATG
jgi:hypothetical protein